MKHLIDYTLFERVSKETKLFESWSEPYTLDFQDQGFELEEIGQKIKGKYQGKIVISDLNTWYAELIDRLNDEWEVTQSKHSFNSASGRASFEIEIMDKENSGFFTVLKDGVQVKVYPVSFIHINTHRDGFSMSINCKLENGSKTSFSIYYSNSNYWNQSQPEYPRPSLIRFGLGSKTRGIDFDKSELEGFINLIRGLSLGIFAPSDPTISLNKILTGEDSACDLSLPQVMDKKGRWKNTTPIGAGYIVNK